MELSVIIPTLNGRERLTACLDAVATHAPQAEVLVVNGPSVDGTTGMIKARSDVDVLLETPTRDATVARNAGVLAASGDTVAFLRHDRLIDAEWTTGLEAALTGGADAVTGPTRGAEANTPVNPENIVVRRSVLEAVDGFDEYLTDAGVADLWVRLQKADYETASSDRLAVTQAYGTDGGQMETTPPQPHVVGYLVGKNGPVATRRVLRPRWRSLVAQPQLLPHRMRSFASGLREGVRARRTAGSAGNPNGLSTAYDRSVKRFDWRPRAVKDS